MTNSELIQELEESKLGLKEVIPSIRFEHKILLESIWNMLDLVISRLQTLEEWHHGRPSD